MNEPKATPPEAPVGEQILHAPVLPNSLPGNRGLPTVRGAVQTQLGWSVTIYCASCGVAGGQVPEENCDFAFWLCKECFAKYGHLTNLYVMPDEVFWEHLRQEQLATHGRELSIPELGTVAAADASPLATLLTERRTKPGG